MFVVDEETGAISLNAGDTGAWFVDAARDDGEPFTTDDRVVFTVNNSAGDTILERVYELADEGLGNGTVFVELSNNDTDDWEPGSYTWEMRFAVNPYWVGTEITSGDIVDTPGIDGEGDPMPITVKGVQKYI